MVDGLIIVYTYIDQFTWTKLTTVRFMSISNWETFMIKEEHSTHSTQKIMTHTHTSIKLLIVHETLCHCNKSYDFTMHYRYSASRQESKSFWIWAFMLIKSAQLQIIEWNYTDSVKHFPHVNQELWDISCPTTGNIKTFSAPGLMMHIHMMTLVWK